MECPVWRSSAGLLSGGYGREPAIGGAGVLDQPANAAARRWSPRKPTGMRCCGRGSDLGSQTC